MSITRCYPLSLSGCDLCSDGIIIIVCKNADTENNNKEGFYILLSTISSLPYILHNPVNTKYLTCWQTQRDPHVRKQSKQGITDRQWPGQCYTAVIYALGSRNQLNVYLLSDIDQKMGSGWLLLDQSDCSSNFPHPMRGQQMYLSWSSKTPQSQVIDQIWAPRGRILLPGSQNFSMNFNIQ